MQINMMGIRGMASRSFITLLLLGMMLSFGAGHAYSGLKSSYKDMIRIAYTNGYKDALEHTFKLEQEDMSKLQDDFEHMKKHVTSASDAYINKVVSLNYAK